MVRKKTIKNLGELKGKVLLFGGVYSNLPALEQLMEIAKQENISEHNVICTGDIVGYCAQPEEVVQLVRKWKIHNIAGNVEIQLRAGEEDCGCDFDEGSRCDIFSRQWYPFAQEKLSKESIDWMEELPDFIKFDFCGKKCLVIHGSYFETSEYIFQSTPDSVKIENFKKTNSEIIIAGHSGLPFSQNIENKLWLNPGVIGMPANDGTTRVWFMILEQGENGIPVFRHQYLEYEHQKSAKLMIDNHLPPEYAKTLLTGIWDNCEILPDKETKLQGVPIDFLLQKT